MKWEDIAKGAAAAYVGTGKIAGGIGATYAFAPSLADKLWGPKPQQPVDNFDKNARLQREFAQNSIKWKVDDARRAGVHPIYALGASGASFSPMYSTDSGSPDANPNMKDLVEAGQNITGAISRSATQQQRQMQALNLESAQLDNEIKRTQLRQMQMSSPGIPSSDGNFMPGQGNSGIVQPKPATPVVSQPGRPAQEAGWSPDVGYSRTDSGLTPVVPQSLSESLEDDFIGKLQWRWRNNLMPNMAPQDSAPPRNQLPKGYDVWDWNVWKQEWQPAKYEKGTIYREPRREWRSYKGGR